MAKNEEYKLELFIVRYLASNGLIDDKLAAQAGKILEGAQAPSKN